MPPHDPFPVRFAWPFPQAHCLSALGTHDNGPHQTRDLGLFRKPAPLSISLISRMLPWESPSQKGPKRPSFSHCAFLATAPPCRTAVHCMLSSPRPSLRAPPFPRFLLLPGSAKGTCFYGERVLEVTPPRKPGDKMPAVHAGMRQWGRIDNLSGGVIMARRERRCGEVS